MSSGCRVRGVNGRASKSREIDEANIPAKQSAPETYTRLSRPYEHGGGPPGVETPAREGSQTPYGNGSSETAVLTPPDRKLPRSRRIRKRAEYLRLQKTGQRRVCRGFVVITTRGSWQESRIGITASRRVGGAVVRNRVKRLVREFFRNYRHHLTPQRDVLVIARPHVAKLSYSELKRELGRALNIDVDQ